MYTMTYGSEVLYDPRDEDRQLTDIECKMTVVEADSLTFTMHRGHPLYGRLAVMDRDSEVVLRDGGDELFRGRITDASEDFYGSVEYTCESNRAYLNDALVPVFTTDLEEESDDFAGEVVNGNVTDLFTWLVARYNEKMYVRHRFAVGYNEGFGIHPGKVYASCKSQTSRKSVWAVMKEAIVDEYGGVVRMRRVGDATYIDLLASGRASAQRIEFGKNLLDFTRTVSGVELATRIVPVGKTVEVSHVEYDEDGNEETVVDVEAGQDVLVSSLPDTQLANGYAKLGDAVADVEAEIAHGVIERVVEYADISDPWQLVDAARRDLLDAKVGDTVEVPAIDLHLVDPSIESIAVGSYVRVTSEPNGFDGWFVCRERTVHPKEPENDKFVLGSEKATQTAEQSRMVSELNASIAKSLEVAVAASDAAVLSAEIAGEAETAAAEASKAVGEVVEDVQSAKEAATQAKDAADAAQSSATWAEAAAEDAQRDASDAKTKAEQAVSDASEAAKTATDFIYVDDDDVPVFGDMRGAETTAEMGQNVRTANSAVEICDGDTVNARFGKDSVELAMHDDVNGYTHVDMCGSRVRIKGATAQDGTSMANVMADHLWLGTDGDRTCKTSGLIAFDSNDGHCAQMYANSVNGMATATATLTRPKRLSDGMVVTEQVAKYGIDETNVYLNGPTFTHADFSSFFATARAEWTSVWVGPDNGGYTQGDLAGGITGSIKVRRVGMVVTIAMNVRFHVHYPAWVSILTDAQVAWLRENVPTGGVVVPVFANPSNSWVFSCNVNPGAFYLWDTAYGHGSNDQNIPLDNRESIAGAGTFLLM